VTTQPDEIRIDELGNHVAAVTIDRPEARNAVTLPVFRTIVDNLRALDADDGVRAIIVRGTGCWFCSGADVREVDLAAGAAGTPKVDPAEDIYRPILRISTPVLGCINGAVAGGGLGLALACDVRVAGESAVFTTSFTRFAMVAYDGIGWLLPRVVGLPNAFELLYRPQVMKAGEALRLGLVNRVVPDAELADYTLEWARQIAALPPVAVRLSKRLIAESPQQSLPDYFRFQELLTMINAQVASGDIDEGVAAFLEKREPRFSGAHLTTGYDIG
jgi:2-(1,2-epoxy-1,2-dihydrophenyl)acetyl-CoA isomerase